MAIRVQVRELTIEDKERWNNFVSNCKWSDLLQLWPWGEVKKSEGWEPLRLAVFGTDENERKEDGQAEKLVLGAQILLKRAPLLGNYLYIPHGPVFQTAEELNIYWPVLKKALLDIAIKNKCFVIEIEPCAGIVPRQKLDVNLPEPRTSLAHFLDPRIKEIFLETDFIQTKRNMQPKYKLYYDLTMSEEELLAQMKKNTRYNVRLAEKKGVVVREYNADDPLAETKLKIFYDLLLETQERAKGYPIRPFTSFVRLLKEFKGTNYISIFEASYKGDIIAVNISQRTNYWSSSFYAASNRLHPEVKATYLLRWESILSAKKCGCKIYDFWGIIPDSAAHKGYSDTKLSFGGTRIDTYGILAWPIEKFKFWVWDTLLPLRSRFRNLWELI